MPYAESVNMTGIAGIFDYANSVTDGVFGIGMVISLYIVIFGYLSMRGEQAMDCALVAGFITSIASTFLLLLGLINGYHLFIVFLLTVIPTVWGYMHKS